jgi:hypothetical protein
VSQAATSAEAHITVCRWNNSYFVPAGHPRPEDLRQRLDRCVTERLPGYCGASLAGFLNPDDPSVWRIRELQTDFSVEMSLQSDELIARNWAEDLAWRIAAVARGGEQSESILCFENRIAYLAQFILDLAAGQAWGKWYYEEFESLRSLSLSQTLGETFVREPGEAAAVVLRLASAQRLEGIVSVVTEGDARKIYQTVFKDAAGANAADENLWVGRLLELWNEGPLCPARETAGRYRDSLRLLARAAMRFPGAETLASVKIALDGLLELRQVLGAVLSPAALDGIIAALARQDLAGAVDLATRAGASDPRAALEFFSRTMAGDAEWGMQAAGVVLSDQFQNEAARARTVSHGEPLLTACGGIFLLGPSFLELNVHDIVAGAMAPGDETRTTAGVFRQMMAMKCLGRLRSSETMNDAALRFFSGFQGADFFAAAQALNAGKSNLERTQSALTRNLAAKSRCEGRCLLAEAVSLPGTSDEVLLLRDLLQDQWVFLAEMPGGDPALGEVLEAGMTLVSQATGNEPEILLLAGRLSALKDSAILSRRAARVLSFESANTFSWEAVAGEFSARPEQLARASRPAAPDLAYFTLRGPGGETLIDAALDLTWSLAARAAVRHFAGRLPGFASSSAEHLYQNFLAGVSTVRTTSELIEVRLPQCPLSIVLRLSGAWDQTFALPWLDGRQVCLLPPVT